MSTWKEFGYMEFARLCGKLRDILVENSNKKRPTLRSFVFRSHALRKIHSIDLTEGRNMGRLFFYPMYRSSPHTISNKKKTEHKSDDNGGDGGSGNRTENENTKATHTCETQQALIFPSRGSPS